MTDRPRASADGQGGNDARERARARLAARQGKAQGAAVSPASARPARTSRATAGKGPRKPPEPSRRAPRAAQPFEPSLWTKPSRNAQRSSRSERTPSDNRSAHTTARAILQTLAAALAAAASLLARGLRRFACLVTALARRSKAAAAVLVLVAVLAVIGVVDAASTWGKVYAGVRIGDVDVAGMTVDDAAAAVEAAYADRVASRTVTVYASEEAASEVRDALAEASDIATAEQRSVEEGRANKRLWTADAASLGAEIPARALAEEALAVGRSEGGLGARLAAGAGGWDIPVYVSADSSQVEALAADIDQTIGDPCVD